MGELASASGLTELVNAAIAAGLNATMGTGGPYTVFAPTNAAFTAAMLGSPSASELANVLTFHVVNGRILSSDLSASQTVPTLQGGSITITSSGGAVRVSGGTTTAALVTSANNQACNAVVHIIDKVLLPGMGALLIPSAFGLLLAVLSVALF